MPEKKEVLRNAVIDIGTNSVKLFIAEAQDSGIRILESLKNIVPLGKDVFYDDRISQETINRTASILTKYKEKIAEYMVSSVKVIATTAVREAQNTDIFVDTILRRTGFSVEVLTIGDVIYYIDAHLYETLRDKYPLHTKNLLIAQLGAGSLDISVMAQGYTLMSTGLPIGTLRLKQLMSKLDGSLRENYVALEEHIANEFSALRREMPQVAIDDIIIIDENYAAYLDNILKDAKFKQDFFSFTEEDSGRLSSLLLDKRSEEIGEEYRIPAEITDTVPAYAIILNNILRVSTNHQIYILETSLAEAILANTLLDYEISPKYNKTNQLISAAISLSTKYHVDLAHAEHVADLAEELFTRLKDTLGLKKADLLYLLLAAYLHDIGMFVNSRAHHKHSEYLVTNLNLFRLTEEEIKIIACISRYHRKGSPQPSHLLYNALPKDKQVLVMKLSAVLRIANALDRTHKQKVKKIDVSFNAAQDITVVVSAEGNFILEKSDFTEKKDLLEEMSGHPVNLKIQAA